MRKTLLVGLTGMVIGYVAVALTVIGYDYGWAAGAMEYASKCGEVGQ